MRFVLVSTHVDQTTGYSKVVSNLLAQVATLAPKVKTFHFGFQRHPEKKNIRKVPEGIVAYDAAANEDPKEEGFGFNKIHEYIEMVGPDVVMIYNDPMIIARFIQAMKYKKGETPYKLWLYVDQVYQGINPQLMDELNKSADKVYCFTDSWAQTYTEYGKDIPLPKVIEHAVDSTIFSNMPPVQRTALRKNVGLPPEGIVFLNANRNSQRKRQDLTIMGFVELLRRHPGKPLWLLMVTSVDPQKGAYYDIQRIFADQLQRAGLDVNVYGKRMAVVDTAPPNTLNDEGMNQIYNMCDIGINTSDGEGFGLCQLEHLYTGAPQVVTDVGSYRSFLPTTVAAYVRPGPLVYQAAGMPLGLSSPSFNPDDVASAMESTIEKYVTMQSAAREMKFKTWSDVCASWLSDLKTAST
uniref:Glycosyl transferase family 1 domain-containing protein n=1 Tax=viral metagenome TaxID=1070528 RepID=A0A6C0AJJ2_9ZZZZ